MKMKMVAGENPAGGRAREVFRNFFDIFGGFAHLGGM